MNKQVYVGCVLAVLLQTGPVSAGDVPVTITLLGDGHINGAYLNAPDRFAARMTSALVAEGVDVTIKTAGYRLSTDLGLSWLTRNADGQALLAAPSGQAVILAIGAHDCDGESKELTIDQTRANLDQMLNMLKDKGIPVLLVGETNYEQCGADYGADFRTLYPELAALHKVPLYPNFMDGIEGHPEFAQDRFDCLHPNERGEELIAIKMLPMVKSLVDQVGKLAS